MSMFRTAEWQRFQELFQFYKIDFDQGRMGHQRCKPTTIFTSMEFLMQLHGLHGPPSTPPEDLRDQPLERRIAMSKKWAEWAPGLKLAFAVAIQQHLKCLDSAEKAHELNPLLVEPRARPASLQQLNKGPDQQESHFQYDHEKEGLRTQWKQSLQQAFINNHNYQRRKH